MTLRSSLRSTLCALLLAAGIEGASAAADPVKIGTMLTAALATAGGVTITFDKPTAKGDDITFPNVKLAIGDNTATIPNLVISGAVERPGGGFTARRIAFDAASAHAKGADAKWATAAVEDVLVPSAKEIDAHAKVRPFRKLTLGNLSLTQSAKGPATTFAAVAVDVGEVSDAVPATIRLTATGAKMPVGFVGNAISNAMLSRMGYTEFAGTVTLDSTYDTTRNSIAVNSLVVDVPKVGKIAFAAKFSNTSLGGIADPDETTEARAAARLDSVMLRFEDGGFVAKMLDMQAEVYGGTKEEVRDALVYGALPLVLNYVENVAFRTQFMDAAEMFLANPKNITFTATPPQPVPLGEAMRTAIGAPLKLPDLLSPQVAANK